MASAMMSGVRAPLAAASMAPPAGLAARASVVSGFAARTSIARPQGVDLNMDNFNLSAPTRVKSEGLGASWGVDALDACVAIDSMFWSSLDGESDGMFKDEDKNLLKEIFNPHLSDRRDDGDRFVPPDTSYSHVQKLRNLVQEEQAVRHQRKDKFFSRDFSMDDAGSLFPFSWNSSIGLKNGTSQSDSLWARPEYVAQAAMFDHVLKSAVPSFDKSTEDGLQFRVYRFGSLEVRTTRAYDGKEVVGAVFSIPASTSMEEGQKVEDHEKLAKATEYVEMTSDTGFRFYVVLETEEGSVVVTETLKDGTVTWQENPKDVVDRNSIAKVVKSVDVRSRNVTVEDMRTYCVNQKASRANGSKSKRYAQCIIGVASGLPARRLACDSVIEQKRVDDAERNYMEVRAALGLSDEHQSKSFKATLSVQPQSTNTELYELGLDEEYLSKCFRMT